MIRKATVIILLGLVFGGIGLLFWHNEWVYSLPTPVPENYRPVDNRKTIDLALEPGTDTTKPIFLHFFNPACPCSRFNMAHFKSIAKEYSQKANFMIVVLSNNKYTVKDIQSRFGLSLPVLFDSTIAASCGVYSTPQAVIIDTGDKIFYRGNYNRSRYCTDKKTEYAKIALDSLLNDSRNVVFDQFALKAYGCQLPKCSK